MLASKVPRVSFADRFFRRAGSGNPEQNPFGRICSRETAKGGVCHNSANNRQAALRGFIHGVGLVMTATPGIHVSTGDAKRHPNARICGAERERLGLAMSQATSSAI
jgi:hypothetical protein